MKEVAAAAAATILQILQDSIQILILGERWLVLASNFGLVFILRHRFAAYMRIVHGVWFIFEYTTQFPNECIRTRVFCGDVLVKNNARMRERERANEEEASGKRNHSCVCVCACRSYPLLKSAHKWIMHTIWIFCALALCQNGKKNE